MFSCCRRRAPGRGAPWPPGSSAPPASAHPRAARGWGRRGGTRLPGASLGRLSGGGCGVSFFGVGWEVEFVPSARLVATHQGWIGGVASALGPHQVQGLQGGVVVRGHPALRPATASLHWGRVRGREQRRCRVAFNAVVLHWWSLRTGGAAGLCCRRSF